MTRHLVADSRLVPFIFHKNPWLGLLKHFPALVPAASATPKGIQDPYYRIFSNLIHTLFTDSEG